MQEEGKLKIKPGTMLEATSLFNHKAIYLYCGKIHKTEFIKMYLLFRTKAYGNEFGYIEVENEWPKYRKAKIVDETEEQKSFHKKLANLKKERYLNGECNNE